MLYISILWNFGPPGSKVETGFNYFYRKFASKRLISLTDNLTGEVSPTVTEKFVLEYRCETWLRNTFGIFGPWTLRHQEINWAFFKCKFTHSLKTVGWPIDGRHQARIFGQLKSLEHRFFKTNGSFLHLRVVKIMVRKAMTKFAHSETPWGFRLSPKCKNRIVFSESFRKPGKWTICFSYVWELILCRVKNSPCQKPYFSHNLRFLPFKNKGKTLTEYLWKTWWIWRLDLLTRGLSGHVTTQSKSILHAPNDTAPRSLQVMGSFRKS